MNRTTGKLIVTLFMLPMCLIHGQDANRSDSLYHVSFADKILLKANLETLIDSYSVKTEEGPGFELNANNSYRLFLSLDYEFLGVTLGFSPSFLAGNDDDNLRGKSSFTDYSFRFFLGDWVQRLQYKRVEGFYVANTGDFVPGWIEGQDPYLQLPDFKTIFWNGATALVLNPNFSLRNVVYNTEWQRKSAGSLVPELQYGYSRISSSIGASSTYENNYDVRVAAHYYYTFVLHRNWFINVLASPSFGIQFSSGGNQEPGSKYTDTRYPFALDGGMQLGYSSERIIFGANVNFANTWYTDTDRTHVLNDQLYAKLYFGYRFGAPPFIERTFKQIGIK